MSSAALSSIDDDAVADIVKFSHGKDGRPKAAAATVAAFKPRTIALPAGCKWFSEVFGWTPKHLPRDIPVAVFEPQDWPEASRPYIPGTLPNGGLWAWPQKQTEHLALALHAGDRTLIHGPTGSGKSALVEAWAHMTKIPLWRINCHGEQQSTDFLGKDIIDIDAKSGASFLRYDWSLTTLAAKSGGILLLDEVFRSPVLMSIQALMERNGTLTLPDAASLKPAERRIVPPAGKFWLVMTDNTNGTGDDSGAYNAEVQDLSTLGRITSTIEVPYQDAEAQAELLKKAHPSVPDDTLTELSQWADLMRRAFMQKNVMQPICLRVLLSILAKYELTGSLELSISLAYLSKLGAADKLVACNAFQQATARELEV